MSNFASVVNNNHWPNNREKIYGWMVANDQKPYAELYKGAVFILYEKPPGYVRFVSHAVRDLMNGMAAAKKGVTRKQVQYSQLVDKLQELWIKHRLPNGNETFRPSDSVIQKNEELPIPIEIESQIQLLICKHSEGRRRGKESPFLFFQVFLPNNISFDMLPPAYPKMWTDLQRWFMEQTHQGNKPPKQEVFDQIETQFCQLETILLSVADRYSNTITTLDEILENTNA